MDDAKEIQTENTHPYVRADMLPNGPAYEISANMSSLILFGIAAHLQEMARAKWLAEMQASQNTQKGIAIVRDIPQDFKRRRRN